MEQEKTTNETQSSTQQVLVELNNVTKIFSRSVWAIKKVNFKIYQQDVIALVGRNGSGKTSLAQLIGNIAKQTSGNIDYFFNSENIFQAIGYQSREQSWPIGFLVDDVIKLYVTAFEVKDKVWMAKLMSVFDIEEIKAKKLSKLNILSLQLFAIFLVLLYKPELLVIDEFSSAISFEKKMKILNLLKEYRAEGGTIILVQPEDFILNALCNRIITLNNGEIQDDLKLNQVLKEYGSTFEYIRRLTDEAKNYKNKGPINRSFEVIFRKYREAQTSLENVYRQQFNNNFKSGDQELDLDIKNAIYYVDLGYDFLFKSLNEQTTKATINETTKIFKKTIKYLHQTLSLFKKHKNGFHNDVRFKRIEIELQKILTLLEEKIIPILKNNQVFNELEEIDYSSTLAERKQLKSLKRRYIREEIRIMKLEQKRNRNLKQKGIFKRKIDPETSDDFSKPLPEVAEILKERVDATVVIGPDDTIELVPNKTGKSPNLVLANPKKIRKIDDKTVKNSTLDATLKLKPESKPTGKLFTKKKKPKKAGDQ